MVTVVNVKILANGIVLFYKMNFKTVLKTFFIDILFILVLYGFFKIMSKKISTYILFLQYFDISKLSENISNINLMKEQIAILNSIVSKIAILLFLALLGIFLLYCLFQSLNWNLAFNNKFKNYKKYFLKFFLINIPVWAVSCFILFKMIYNARGLIISSWVKETYLNQLGYGSLPSLFIYTVLFFIISYFSVMVYIHLNKHKFFKAIKLSLKEFKNYKLILKYLGLWLIFALLLLTIKIHPLLWFILALIQIQFCRIILNAGVRIRT